MPKLETKAIIDRLTSRLTAEMQKRSWKASPLSKAAGLNESAVRDILRGRSQNPGIVTISRIASLLEVRPGALFEDTGVLERLGFVGEGGDVSITSTIVIKEAAASWGGPARGAAARRRAARRAAAEEAAEKPTPEQALELLRENSGLFLLEVRTSALEPYTFQGDNLIVERTEREVTEADLLRPCLCNLPTGAKRIARLRAGDEPGKFHVQPLDPRKMVEPNVQIERLHRVICSLPPLGA